MFLFLQVSLLSLLLLSLFPVLEATMRSASLFRTGEEEDGEEEEEPKLFRHEGQSTTWMGLMGGGSKQCCQISNKKDTFFFKVGLNLTFFFHVSHTMFKTWAEFGKKKNIPTRAKNLTIFYRLKKKKEF